MAMVRLGVPLKCNSLPTTLQDQTVLGSNHLVTSPPHHHGSCYSIDESVTVEGGIEEKGKSGFRTLVTRPGGSH